MAAIDADVRKKLERLADALVDAAVAYRDIGDVVALGLDRFPELENPVGDEQNGLSANRLSRLLRDAAALGVTKPLARAEQQFQFRASTQLRADQTARWANL